MEKSFRSILHKNLNKLLSFVALELVRRRRKRFIEEFMHFRETLLAANEVSLSTRYYFDVSYNLPVASQETVNRMVELEVFSKRIERACEIDPGSGQYLEKTLGAYNPAYYEIYEKARP